MPITVHIRPDDRLVVLAHAGPVQDDEFLSSYRTLFDDARYDKSFNVLVDLRRAESAVRSPEVLRDLAEFVKPRFENTQAIPMVAVVAPEDISFGLARMYEAFSDPVSWEFKVFRSAEEALLWLGLPEALVDDLDRNAPDPPDSD
jgi:hypothetical protein